MKKLIAPLLLLVGLILWVIIDNTEQPKMHKVGVLSHASIADPSFQGFKDGLTELGFIEGQNITYIYEGATGDISLLEEASQNLLDANVDLILTLTTPAALQAQKDTRTSKLPIIFAPASNPLKTGLVKSIQSPGMNLTGVTFGLQEKKRMEWFLTLVPEAKNIYYPYNSKDKSPVAALAHLNEYLKTQKAQFIEGKVHSVQEMQKDLHNSKGKIDTIYLTLDALVSSNLDIYVEYAIKNKLPLSVPARLQVERGALMSYGFSVYDLGKQAARMAKEVFEGVAIENIPVEHAEFKLSINTTTAKKIGLEIEQNILNQAILFQ